MHCRGLKWCVGCLAVNLHSLYCTFFDNVQEDQLGPSTQYTSGCSHRTSLLTASLAGAAIDGGHPQVGRASVKDNFEGLGGSANGDHTIVRQLEGDTRAKTSLQKTIGTVNFPHTKKDDPFSTLYAHVPCSVNWIQAKHVHCFISLNNVS